MASPSRSLPLRLFIFMVVAGLTLSGIAPNTSNVTVKADPITVGLPGNFQTALGCAGNWDPACAATKLTYDPTDDVWQGTFNNIPAGNWEYKAAMDDAWTENYGLGGVAGGPNIPLALMATANVKFYFDYKSKWITDNVNSIIATAPGDYQSEIGCGGDWQPDCLRSWLQDLDGDGIYSFEVTGIAVGNYETKVAINEGWAENYGEGGVPGGNNISFRINATTDVLKVTFDTRAGNRLPKVYVNNATPNPQSVTVVGSVQSEITGGGCGDWDPACAAAFMTLDAEDDVWKFTTVSIPAGSYEYKAAINGGWGENYGQGAVRNGGNIPFNPAAPITVTFYYDHKTHWITHDQENLGGLQRYIVTAPGSYTTEIGCVSDWAPDCMRSWLQDPDNDGIYSYTTERIPPGVYEFKITIDQSWTLNYGAGGAQNGANIGFTVPAPNTYVTFTWNSVTKVPEVIIGGAPAGDLNKEKAYWVLGDTIAWNPGGGAAPTDAYYLHYDPAAGLGLTTSGVTGGSTINLTYDPAGLPAAVQTKFPHIASYQAYKISAADLPLVKDILKGQFAVSVVNGGTTLLDATGLQIQGVLDDLFDYTGPLGITFNTPPTIRVWAPTAQDVNLLLYANSAPATVPTSYNMSYDSVTGVWTITGDESWNGQYYQYEVTVFAPTTGQIETNRVTDPYSLALSRNSQRTLIVNPDEAATKPAGWDNLVKPALDAPEDIVIYELHVRDFSVNDPTVSAANRGTFRAFTELGSAGMTHLAALAQAGLTHVHILPAFDIATVNEDKSAWLNPDMTGCPTPPTDSNCQQAAVETVRGQDGFNWGYDPLHYTAPEGSYSTDPDGAARVREFREMVQALNSIGIRVVMDVVYNHTNASGQSANAVLDRIVPGYYHRLNNEGGVERSSCCDNTASEFEMMEKLLIDSVLTWSRDYKVDGFRFDLMGHHMRANMVNLRTALDALQLPGIDGRDIYVYGEAWNFGEVQDNARGVNAIQRNMAGTGIGSFNDRMRDGVRGGGPFDDVRIQGYATGLLFEPNPTTTATYADQLATLLLRSDWIKLGLAGTLANYQFVDRNGNLISGNQLDYQGQLAGYTADPQEVINYISAHDNETWWDTVQVKTDSATSLTNRIRANNLGLAVIMFSQGIPFFHAGDDILRSKSLDRNSYDSGDWFNRIDWSYLTNNWAVGLPLQGENGSRWPFLQPLLANAALQVNQAQIMGVNQQFREMLQIRRSSILLRLRTAQDISERMDILNTGPSQIPGLLVYMVDDTTGTDIDGSFAGLVVLFNAQPNAVTYTEPALANLPLSLHPVLAASSDPVNRTSTYTAATGTFVIPGRTYAVFTLADPDAPPTGGGTAGGTTGGSGPSSLPATGYVPASEDTSSSLVLLLAGLLVLTLGGLVVSASRRR
ncbi:pullulanase [Anaerolineae bacterium]|nr:pullulanase [Anaerolineae bacterium]